MDIKIIAMVAASLLCSVVFVGCSCSKSIDKDEKHTDQIEMDAKVTLSSKASYTTSETEHEKTTSASTETSETSDTTGTKASTTRASVSVQYVGDPNAFYATTQPVVQTVIVTVTLPPETTAAAEETTVAATQDMPNAAFDPERDLMFTVADDLVLKVGTIHDSLSTYAESYAPANVDFGGGAAYIYQFANDLTVKTEYLVDGNGTAGEVITDITFRSDKFCTNKGIKSGSSIDEIYAAYGTEKSLFDAEKNMFSYQTDNGYVMEFYTDGNFVTEIKYRMINQ